MFTSRVLVSGVQRAFVSVSVDRELPGDLPAQVVAASGITQASGSIEWAAEQDVETMARNPWNASTGWLPKRGERVVVYAGDGSSEWVIFTGLIDKTTGNVGGGFQSEIIDDYDRLSARVSHNPLLSIMPPRVAAGPYRGVGLTSAYYVDYALRAAGFHVTPPMEANAALFAPLQSSVWPHRGTVDTAGSKDGTAAYMSNAPAPWGFAARNFDVRYIPHMANLPSVPVQLTALCSPTHTGNAFLTAQYGTGSVQLAITATRIAIARVNGVEACRVTLGAATIVSILVKSGVVTIKTDLGVSVTGSGTISGSTPMSSITSSGDDPARLAGIQVSHPTETWMELLSPNFKRSAIIDASDVTLNGITDAARTIRSERVDDLLTEISQSTLTAMWIDELGVFHWAPSRAIRNAAAIQTITTQDDVLAAGWEDSFLASRSKVSVTARIPAITIATRAGRQLYTGNTQSLQTGEYAEEFAEPDTDIDWIMPDETFDLITGSDWSAYNPGVGSFAGCYYTSSGTSVTPPSNGLTVTVQRIGVDTFKIMQQAGSFAADIVAELSTSPENVTLWPNRRDKQLPVLRGFGDVQWIQMDLPQVDTGGVGPELVHDAGVWNARTNDNSVITRIRDDLAAALAQPLPTLPSLEVAPDPRRQLGDVIFISSPKFMGVRLRALVVGISTSFDTSMTQSLSVRLISAVSEFTTYAEYNRQLPGSSLTYAQWQALGPVTESYSGFNDN